VWVFLLLILAVLLFLLGGRLRKSAGLPAGQVVYSDTGAWGRLERPLFSEELGLTGKPDYLVREGDEVVPVEVKSGRAPVGGPHAAHIFQLAAYCALVAETYGRRPRHGLIKYRDALLRVEYTAALERDLLRLLDKMRAEAEAEDVNRSHESAARCLACGFREVCSERLA
jgi:CRISPR-associated exonuclease Cas4